MANGNVTYVKYTDGATSYLVRPSDVGKIAELETLGYHAELLNGASSVTTMTSNELVGGAGATEQDMLKKISEKAANRNKA